MIEGEREREKCKGSQSELHRVKRMGLDLLKHLLVLDGGEPEAVGVAVVVAGAAAVALHEGGGAELL